MMGIYKKTSRTTKISTKNTQSTPLLPSKLTKLSRFTKLSRASSMCWSSWTGMVTWTTQCSYDLSCKGTRSCWHTNALIAIGDRLKLKSCSNHRKRSITSQKCSQPKWPTYQSAWSLLTASSTTSRAIKTPTPHALTMTTAKVSI